MNTHTPHTLYQQLAVNWIGRNMTNAGKLDMLARADTPRWPRAKPGVGKLVDVRHHRSA